MVVHTRATNQSTLEFDPEIERTHMRSLRERIMMAGRTLRELTNPDLTQQPLAITVPPLEQGVTFELKSGVINLLPQFHGLAGEDPIMHLSEFHDICMCSKPSNMTEEQIKMRAFGFTLKDAARNWYYHLPAGTVNTWADLHKAFLKEYFPTKKVLALKKEITNFEQADDETLYECYERFQRLCSSYPYHGFDDQDLVLCLYNGLLNHERRMINAACCGNILNLTPTAAMNMMQDIAEGTRSFGRTYTKKGVSALSSTNQELKELKDELAEIKSVVKEVVKNNQYQPAPPGPSTEMIKTLTQEILKAVTQSTESRFNAMGELMGTFAQHLNTHVQTTNASIKKLEEQMGGLTQVVSTLAQKQSNSLPTQTEVNSQVRNVSAMTLRNGKLVRQITEEEAMERIWDDFLQSTDPRSRQDDRGRGQVPEEFQSTDPRSRQDDRGRVL